MKRETGWERWKDMAAAEGADPGDPDVRIGALLRRAGRPPEPAPARLQRVEARLAARAPRAPRPLLVRWAVAVLLLAATGGAAAAVGLPQRLVRAVAGWGLAARPAERVDVGRRAPGPAAGTRVAQVASPGVAPPAPEEAVGAPSEAPAPAPAVAVVDLAARGASSAPPAPRPRRSSDARAAVVAAPAPPARAAAPPALGDEDAGGALVQEASLLQRAMTHLHRHGDAAGALALLDEHQRRFPLGMLAGEAALARVDALLALGRIEEAAALGRGSPDLPLARRRELQVLEAETLAGRDCARALERFEALQLGVLPGDLRERVLYGRALCKARLGRQAAARADLWRYLDEYPDGRFAAAVRQALAADQ